MLTCELTLSEMHQALWHQQLDQITALKTILQLAARVSRCRFNLLAWMTRGMLVKPCSLLVEQ
jgi:hypothetical protein